MFLAPRSLEAGRGHAAGARRARCPEAQSAPAAAPPGREPCLTPEHGVVLLSLPPALGPVLAQQDLLEGLPEHLVEDGVEDGVDHGRRVAEPRGAVEHGRVDATLALEAADGRHQVQDEEGRPEHDEGKEHDAQDLGGLLLEPDDAAVPGRVPRHDGGAAGVLAAHGVVPRQAG